jgi:hypothetical protein
MTLVDYLKQKQERLPTWLETFNKEKPETINFKTLMSSRVLFYPGPDIDGTPIKSFNKAHYCHVYLYADYNVNQVEMQKRFTNNEFAGYECIHIHEFKVNDLVPKAYKPSFQLNKVQQEALARHARGEKFGFVGIFNRLPSHDSSHGAQRFALIYLGADGIATYDALFASKLYTLEALVLTDHLLGGNYDKFGKGGLMDHLATRSKVFPNLILSADNTEIWDGYDRVPSVDFVTGGMHNSKSKRFIYTKQ